MNSSLLAFLTVGLCQSRPCARADSARPAPGRGLTPRSGPGAPVPHVNVAIIAQAQRTKP